MVSKSETSGAYLSQQKEKHNKKPIPDAQNVLITGTARKGSIGENIVNKISHEHSVDILNSDVTIVQELPKGRAHTALIMCHGVTHLDWMESSEFTKDREIIDVNLTGSINVSKAFVNATIESPVRKTIISIGSMAHSKVLNGSAAYCASKAGLAHYMKCIAWELAPKGYDVFSIHPSNVDGTPMSHDTIFGLMRYRDLTVEEATAYWADNYIRDRSLTTGEISDLVLFLLSGKATFLSGSNFEMTGGQR